MSPDPSTAVAELVREIAGLHGVTVRAGISYSDLAQLEDRLGPHVPAAYSALLLETNGMEVMHEHFGPQPADRLILPGPATAEAEDQALELARLLPGPAAW